MLLDTPHVMSPGLGILLVKIGKWFSTIKFYRACSLKVLLMKETPPPQNHGTFRLIFTTLKRNEALFIIPF